MVKLFKCPVCGKYIHTLRRLSQCTECADINMYGTGVVHKTGVDYTCGNNVLYACPHCNHQDDTVDVFICDDECECDHLNSELILYDGEEIDVCQRCGSILNIDYIGDC